MPSTGIEKRELPHPGGSLFSCVCFVSESRVLSFCALRGKFTKKDFLLFCGPVEPILAPSGKELASLSWQREWRITAPYGTFRSAPIAATHEGVQAGFVDDYNVSVLT